MLQRFVECTNVGSCFNELVSIEKGEVRPQQQLQTFTALYVALQNIAESVEITDQQLNTEVREFSVNGCAPVAMPPGVGSINVCCDAHPDLFGCQLLV